MKFRPGILAYALLIVCVSCGNVHAQGSQPQLRVRLTETCKCVFSDKTGTQSCYTTNLPERFECSGVGECSTKVSGPLHAKVEWESTCGNRHETYFDGKNDVLAFMCSEGELPQARILLSTPHQLNIDFGAWRPMASKKTGPAVVGSAKDYWNTVAVAWNDDHVQSNLKAANEESSPIEVRMINLGGAWASSASHLPLAIGDPMLDDFNYPAGNKGGNSEVLLRQIPKGRYDIYIYGHGGDPGYYGDYTLTVGDRSYGRKKTSDKHEAVITKEWVEGLQYVKFADVPVEPPNEIKIFIQPGATVTDRHGRVFSDAMISGLQLVPRKY